MSEMNSEYQGKHESDAEEPVIGDAPPKADVLLSNSIYDKIKASSLYLLPAFAAAYFGLAQIWGLPNAEEVVGTVAVIETLIGALVKASNVQYTNSDARYDGQIHIEPTASGEHTNLNVSLDPAALYSKKELVVKVKR